MTLTRWYWFQFFMAALGLLLFVLGLLMLLEWPHRFSDWVRIWTPVGICSLALANFLFAVVAEDCFPGALPLVTGLLEVLPWVVVLAVVVGVAL